MRFAAAILCATMAVATCPAAAQNPPPARVDGEVAAPVEILMDFINGDVRCLPPRALLPATDELDLRVINRAERPLMFIAPEFLRAAKILRANQLVEVEGGSFLVGAKGQLRFVLRTPKPGEYYYSCYLPGHRPNPQSSGFLVVAGTGQ
ncbi:hypothetical protein [Rhodoligotrophos defluvii]|uniref:hypothetical protein n=1 Tax=Rhodoligotrophos defluvii TaxID=2561934 RepID=UPI0010C9F46E|nr:hypothetical protein [Rhodoligotrophos defluvii]